MSDGGGGSGASAFCGELVRTHDFARYASTLMVPASRRRPLLALYALNVEISRVHVLVSQPLPGEVRLQWWSDMLAGGGHGGVEGNPVAAELLHAIRTCRLPVARLSRLIEEHQFDLYNDPMPTMAALEGYLNETSSALFSLAAAVMGPPSEAVEHLARHAGLAQGLAHVVASLPVDASRRQCFVPLQLLADQGCKVEDVFAGKDTPQLRAAVGRLLDESRKQLEIAIALLASVPGPVRAAFLPLALLRGELKRMSRADTDPFVLRSMSNFRTLWTLWRASRSRTFLG
jgi:phytoene synthase